MKLLVTNLCFKGYEELFDRFDIEKTFNYGPLTKEDVADADIIIGNIDYNLVQYTEKLKYIHWSMAGSDVIADRLKGRDVILTNSTGCFSVAIAENIIGMILYFFKNYHIYRDNQRNHIFHREGECRSIYDSNILVVGAGSIGNTFAVRANALGAHVTGIKRTPAQKPDYYDNLYTLEKLDECLPEADVIVLCLPQSKDTIRLMDRRRLQLIKDKALLINVGRGTVLDTEALIEMLQQKKIYAALDVFEKEPLDASSPLYDIDDCLVLPHITGTLNLELTRRLSRELSLRNLDSYLNNRKLENVVDFNTGYKVSNS